MCVFLLLRAKRRALLLLLAVKRFAGLLLMVKREERFFFALGARGQGGVPPSPLILQNLLLIGLTALVSLKSSAHWG